ncbi:MAG: DUF2723 domain-containing protein [Candidatus Coatesbacteria bacterium]
MTALASALIFLATAFVNIRRLAPTIFNDDSPETVAAAMTLGITHPPGDPVLVLLGRLACALPVGSPAFRMNLLSALLFALVPVLVWHMMRPWLGPRGKTLAAFAAVALVAGSPVVAQQAAVAKGASYGLNLCLLLGMTWAAGAGRLPAAWLFAGVLAAHHWMTLAAYALCPVVAWALRVPTGWRPTARGTVLGAGLFLLAASPLIAQPLLDARFPAFASGAAHSLPRFAAQLARRPFLQTELRPDLHPVARQVVPVAASLHLQVGWAGWLLVVAAFAWGPRRGILGAALGAAVVLPVLEALFYLSLPPGLDHLFNVFLLPSAIALAALAALGAGAIADHWKLQGLVVAAALVLWAGPGRAPERRPYDVRSATWSFDLARAMLAPLPRGAGLVTISDLDTFALWHAQAVDGFRPDVLVVNWILLRHPWYRERAARLAGDPALMAAPDRPTALAGLLTRVRRPWFTCAATLEGTPPGTRLRPFHLTYGLGPGPAVGFHGLVWRGYFEALSRLPEPHARLAAGYTAECVHTLAGAAATPRL